MQMGSLRMKRSPLDREEKYWKNTLSLLIIFVKICPEASQGLASCSIDNASQKTLLKQIGQCLVT